MENNELFDFISHLETKLAEMFTTNDRIAALAPPEVREGTQEYLLCFAKRLRPALVLMTYGCINENIDEDALLLVAAGIELFHTWTLTQDDIIDNDDMRRGVDTVHKYIEKKGMNRYSLSADDAYIYGVNVAMLVSDIQHALSIDYFTQYAEKCPDASMKIIKLIQVLETSIIGKLVCGEVIDVQFGNAYKTFDSLLELSEDEIINMLWLKTGILYYFAAIAGSYLAIPEDDMRDRRIISLANFAGKCGIAFQLQDDILGIVGTQEVIGKPIGSDIREGKKTTILLESIRNASFEEKAVLESIIGNKKASKNDIQKATELLIKLGGIEYTKKLAKKYIEEALTYIAEFPESHYKTLLLKWAHYMYNREF